MADTKKSEVVITCNAQQPKAAVRAMETELKRLQAAYKQLSDAGKAGTERAKQMAHEIKELSIAVKEGKANMDKIVTVTNNLSNSSLSQLQRALRQVKKEMGRVSTDSPKLDDLRQKYKAITDQIKILQGEMVNIQKHMGNLSQTSDAWLSRAINQQKQLVAQTDKNSNAYQRQVNVLHQLQAEQANRAFTTVSGGGANAEALRAARANLVSYRDQLGKGGIMPASGNVSAEIERINLELKKCDEQLDVISGKEKKIEPTVQEIEQDVTKLVGSLANASPEQLRKGLEQCRNQLDKMASNDPNRQKWVTWAKQLKTALEGVDREAVDIDKVMRNLKKEPLENLRKAAKQLEEEMVKLNREDAKYKDRQNQLQKIRGEIDSVTRSINNQASAWSTTFRNISMYFGVFQLFSMAQQKLQEMLRSNLAYSDQLADIRKVTGLATKDVDELAESIAKLDTRTSIQELSDLAYQGGKMGFGKYGVEGMVEFVRAADQVKVALSDDLGEDSLLQISKLIDTMGLIPKLGVEKSMLSVGSAINQLAATSTASGTHIVDFSKRLTGLSRITGITTPELLALGSAADALGQAPEVAATAFGKLFTSLQTNHNLIEQQLNMEKGTINNLFSQGKAMEAILQIMEKMREKGNMNALGNIWKDLGSDGQRLIGVMATMSKNVDTVRAHVEEANEAFEEATSLTTEYAMKQETANAILERANQLWVRTFVNPEGVDTVKELSQAWYDMSQKLTSSALYMGQIRLVLTMIIAAVKLLVFLLPTLIQFLLFKGAYMGVMALYRGFVAMRTAIIGAMVAQQGLNTAMKANIFGLVISLIASAVVWLTNYGNAADDAANKQKTMNEYIKEAAAEIDKETRKLESYKRVLEDANTSQAQRERILRQFNRTYGTYLNKLGIEVNSVDDLRKHYALLNDELRKKIYYQTKQRAYDQELGDKAGELGKKARAFSDLTANNQRDGSFAAYDTKWLEDQINQAQTRYGSVNWVSIYSDMVESRFGKRTDGRSGFNNDYSVFTDMAGNEHYVKSYGDAIREYVSAWQEYNKTKKSIDAALDPLIGDYDPFAETPGELTNDAADKEAEKRRRAEEAARRKALRAEMREEQDKAKAIIDNVKNYYERQIAAITEMATRTGMDSELQKKLVDGMTVRMNSALANVRQAIAGTENEWADFRQSMLDDLYEPLSADGTNQSTQLLDNIIHNDIDQLKKMIETLSKELGQNGSVLLDQIWRKATENELANVKQANSAYQARQKVLLEKNYTGKVNRDYEGQMEQLGVAELTPSQSQQLMKWSQEGKSEDIQNFVDSRSNLWQQAFLKAREHIVDVFAADVSTEDGQKAMLTLLFGEDYNGTLSGSALESMLNMDLQQWQVFYQKLIEMSDAYTDAQKKAYDEAKRRADFVFNNRPDIQGIDKATQDLSTINSDQQRFGSDKNFTQQLGMSWNMDSDPEILRYRLLSEKARLYYQEMKSLREQDKISEQQLTDAKRQMMEAQTAMADKVAAKFNERVQLLQSFSEPMATFAEGVGEYLGNLIYDTEQTDIKLKDLARDMLKAYAKMTLQLMAEDLTRRVTKQLYHRQEEADETLHQQTLLQIQQMYQALMLTAQQTGDAARLTQHSTSNAAELSEEATATTGKVGLGIAGGAAKIIGTLGFWGIPLIAVITALLMGLLSWAISAAFGGSDSGGADSGPNVKLSTGMLTYDGGNVQSVGGGSTPSGDTTSPVLGTDGKVYNAKQVGKLQTGIVTQPIATIVNGQPSLVGEKGPEMVIGRETTAAMQMARPDLINEIVKFDKNFSGRGFRTYDDGNLSDFDTVPDASAAGGNMLTSDDIQGFRDTMAEFTAMMLLLQKNGLHVNKFGRGSVTQESADGAAFMRRNSGDRLWRKG